MSKAKKRIIIILVIIFFIVLAAAVVCSLVIPTEFRAFLKHAWDGLNEPLPVVGISLFMILCFIARMYAKSSYGKKQIREFKEHVKELEAQFQESEKRQAERITEMLETIEQQTKTINHQNEIIESQNITIKDICKATPNKKVKEIGAKFNGEKEKNSQTGTDKA